MAEGLFKDLIDKENLKDIEVSSAGINAIPHQHASTNSVEVMKEKGLSLDDHETTMLSISLVEEVDLILTMTLSHKTSILSSAPWLEGKVFTLKEYVRLPGDITDPFGGSVETYRICLEDIEQSLELLVEKLKEEA